jgi:hypothetical protein
MEANDPMGFLKSEMSSDNLCDRVNAVYRTTTIATLIGNDKVKKELIPYYECLNLFFPILMLNSFS